jgi:hypothetical protein
MTYEKICSMIKQGKKLLMVNGRISFLMSKESEDPRIEVAPCCPAF